MIGHPNKRVNGRTIATMRAIKVHTINIIN